MIAIDGDSLYSANGNACENVSRTFTLFQQGAFTTAANQVAHKPPNAPNHRLASSPFRAPKGSCHAPMLLHTRIFQSVKIDTALSRARLYYRGMRVACRWHAFVAPKTTYYGDEIRERYRKLRVYSHSIVNLVGCILAMLNVRNM